MSCKPYSPTQAVYHKCFPYVEGTYFLDESFQIRKHIPRVQWKFGCEILK